MLHKWYSLDAGQESEGFLTIQLFGTGSLIVLEIYSSESKLRSCPLNKRPAVTILK